MQRRTFLQSLAAMAAGGFASGILGAPEPKGPLIDYELFCADGDVSRYHVDGPFCHGEQVFATDLRCLISHPGDNSGTADGRLPPVDRLCWQEFDAGGWKSLPERPGFDRFGGHGWPQPCIPCLGRGRVGPGVRRNPSASPRSDGAARHIGGALCASCGGSGYSKEIGGDVCERLAGSAFGVGYLAKIRTLGPLEYRVLHDAIAADGVHLPQGVLLFRGAGEVRGFLCGLYED